MKKALVVDDNEGIRRLLHEALTLEGYSVDTVANGSEALAVIRENRGSSGFKDARDEWFGRVERAC